MVRSSPASIAEASPWVAWPSTAWAETSSLAASPDFTPGNQRASRSDDRQGSARKGLGFPSPFFRNLPAAEARTTTISEQAFWTVARFPEATISLPQMDELTSKKQDAERANNEPQRHPTSVALSRPPAAEVDAGTDITLKVKVFCSSGCDLRGRSINVTALDGLVVATSELAEHTEHANETAEFTFNAPDEVGEHSWTLVFPKHEAEGLIHEEGSLPITVKTIAHDTSLAVWGVPSPIVMNHPFRIHVGATCSAGCDLRGKEIEICDETGFARVAMPRGTYELDLLKTGYETSPRVLDVDGDITVEVEATVIPPENPDAYWLFEPTKRI